MTMKIGIDFDNTIICYDGIFHRVACEQGLVDERFPKSKGKIRDHLRERGIEDVWTEMQGYVYGKRILEAEMFPGFMDFLTSCRKNRIEVCVISHKTRYPYRGEPYDLHQGARDWLRHSGLLENDATGLSDARVYFEPTKEAKIQRIASAGCTHFVDDLPEFLAEKAFPGHVQRFVFDPNEHHLHGEFPRISSWDRAFERIAGHAD